MTRELDVVLKVAVLVGVVSFCVASQRSATPKATRRATSTHEQWYSAGPRVDGKLSRGDRRSPQALRRIGIPRHTARGLILRDDTSLYREVPRQ